jgi:acetyl esterase/lipase
VIVDQGKPYLSFSFPLPGPGSLLFKKGVAKASAIRRGRTLAERRDGDNLLADTRIHPVGSHFEPVVCGGVPCEWITLEGSRVDHVILYIHGGSWAFGNLKTARAAGALLAEATGFRVLALEYRLAPEHIFPAALEDCAAVFDWLNENGYPPELVGLFGDSAGGNLSLALIHKLKSEERALPVAIGLASPCTDMTEQSAIARGTDDMLYTQYEGREWDAFSMYLGEHDRKDPLVSPVFGDLAGFPPMLIHVGGDEGLAVDCDVFAKKAHAAGADVSLKIWWEMFHDFTIVGNTLKESRQSLAEFGEFFRGQFEID